MEGAECCFLGAVTGRKADALFGSFLLLSPAGDQDICRFTERAVVAQRGSF